MGVREGADRTPDDMLMDEAMVMDAACHRYGWTIDEYKASDPDDLARMLTVAAVRAEVEKEANDKAAAQAAANAR